MFANKEQLCQSFWQSVQEQNFKAKKIEEGGQFDLPFLKAPRINTSHRLNGRSNYDLQRYKSGVCRASQYHSKNIDRYISKLSCYFRNFFFTDHSYEFPLFWKCISNMVDVLIIKTSIIVSQRLHRQLSCCVGSQYFMWYSVACKSGKHTIFDPLVDVALVPTLWAMETWPTLSEPLHW